MAGAGTERLNIKRIEVWALGSEENLRDQEEYWETRNKEITRIRKVNKKEFVNEAEIFMGSTFYNYGRECVCASGSNRRD